MPALRRYTFKLYPNAAQAEGLDRVRRMHCALYNALLQQRIEAYRRAGKMLTFYDQCKEITALRADDPDYRSLSCKSMEETIKRLDWAFQAFFRRAKAGAGAQSGFPRFQASDRFPGFGLGKHRNGWRFDVRDDGPRPRHGRLYVKDIPGLMRLRGRLPARPEAIKTGDILWRDGAWWLSLVCEMPSRRAAGQGHGRVELDLLDRFARITRVDGRYAAGPMEVFATSDGRIIVENHRPSEGSPAGAGSSDGERRKPSRRIGVAVPTGADDLSGDRRTDDDRKRAPIPTATDDDRRDRNSTSASRKPAEAKDERGRSHFTYESPMPREYADHGIEGIQRRMARCTRGSNKYRKLKAIKARREAKVARRRREELHRLSTWITGAFGSLTIIKPTSIKEATKSGHGTVKDPGALTQVKADFNRRLLEQAPASFVMQLEYKTAEAGVGFEQIASDEVLIGNHLVSAGKAARKAKRISKRKPKA